MTVERRGRSCVSREVEHLTGDDHSDPDLAVEVFVVEPLEIALP